MSDGDAKRSHVRIAAAILAAILVAATVFTYLAYTAAFTSTDTVTVTSPRAGLVMEQRRQGQVPRHPGRRGRNPLSTPVIRRS